MPTLDNRVALVEKRAYIEKQVAIYTNEEKESLQRQMLEEEIQDESFTKAQLESKLKEVRDQLASTKNEGRTAGRR